MWVPRQWHTPVLGRQTEGQQGVLLCRVLVEVGISREICVDRERGLTRNTCEYPAGCDIQPASHQLYVTAGTDGYKVQVHLGCQMCVCVSAGGGSNW